MEHFKSYREEKIQVRNFQEYSELFTLKNQTFEIIFEITKELFFQGLDLH